jgi:hypothetical protein
MEIPQKTRSRTTIKSSNVTPGHIPEKFKAGYNKDTCTSISIAALSIIVTLWKQCRCPITDEWIKEMLCIS